MWHIFQANVSTSPDALLGVGLIGIYFVWMVSMALLRVKRGEHMDH